MSMHTCPTCHGTGHCPTCGGGGDLHTADLPSLFAKLRRDLAPWIVALGVLACVSDPMAVCIGVVYGFAMAVAAVAAVVCMAILS
jgi:hypothetical protein